MTKEYKGYPLFDDVTDDLLQAWNRCNTLVNINQDLGSEEADAYNDQFSDVEKMKIKMLLLLVSSSSKEEVQKMINKTIELESEEA